MRPGLVWELLSQAWLAAHALAVLEGLLSAPGLGVWLAAVWAGTALALKARWRSPVVLGLAVLAPWLLRALVFALGEAALSGGLAFWEPLGLGLDRLAWPASLTGLAAAGLLLLPARAPQVRPLGPLLHGVLLGAVLWTQTAGQDRLYPHPLALAASVGLYLVFQAAAWGAASPRSAEGGQPLAGHFKKRRPWVLALLALCLLIGGLWSWLYQSYEAAALAAGGGLLKPELFRFDFSQYLSLESEITQSEELVLLYRRDGPPQRQYLRRYLLSAYDPVRGFSRGGPRPGAEEDVPTLGRGPVDLVPPAPEGRLPAAHEIYTVNFDPGALIALNAPVRAQPYAQWDRTSFSGAYRVDALIPDWDPWLLADGGTQGLSPEDKAFYTRTGPDPRVEALAKSVTERSIDDLDRVYAILNYLKSNYYYSLRPGVPASGSPLHHFLFEARKGYCSYFAFAMTLMLRHVGIPARPVVGFFVNPEDNVLGFYPVRGTQAHAWVEVWFAGVGWIEFDPTSEELAPGEDFQAGLGVDEDVLKLIQEILNQELRPSEATDSEGSVPLSGSELWRQGSVTLIVALVLVCLALVGLWLAAPGWRYARARSRRRQYGLLLRRLAAQRPRKPGQTWSDWAQEQPGRPGAGLVRRLARAYDEARFAAPAALDAKIGAGGQALPPPLSPRARRRLYAGVSLLLRRLRRQAPWPLRWTRAWRLWERLTW